MSQPQKIDNANFTCSEMFCIYPISVIKMLNNTEWSSISDTNKTLKCNFSIDLSLSKQTYKQYEPVIVKFEVLNHSKKPVKIFNLFEHEIGDASIEISDDSGNTYNSNKMPFSVFMGSIKPSYKIQPDGKLEISMPINNWGKKTEINDLHDNYWYFGLFGYFPPGKYKAHLFFNNENIRTYGCQLLSNEISFEVNELNAEDNELLNKFKEIAKGREYEKLINIINQYPQNDFIEDISAYYLRGKYIKIMLRDKYESNDLILEYNSFFDKYPKSFYLFNHKILEPFFRKFKIDNINIETANKIITNENVKKAAKWFLTKHNK